MIQSLPVESTVLTGKLIITSRRVKSFYNQKFTCQIYSYNWLSISKSLPVRLIVITVNGYTSRCRFSDTTQCHGGKEEAVWCNQDFYIKTACTQWIVLFPLWWSGKALPSVKSSVLCLHDPKQMLFLWHHTGPWWQVCSHLMQLTPYLVALVDKKTWPRPLSFPSNTRWWSRMAHPRKTDPKPGCWPNLS